MAYFIDNKILEQTTKCPYSFQCLNDDIESICSVQWILKENGCFLKTVKPDSCPYKVKISSSYMCNCPTRHELFVKYRI
jgi:hypothetical protein